jgi:beta-mannosidase
LVSSQGSAVSTDQRFEAGRSVSVARGRFAIDLDGEWSFAYADHPIDVGDGTVDALRRAGLTVYPATVPGNFELDLRANGLIDEPFYGMNIVGLRRFEGTYVYYCRTFVAPVSDAFTPWLVFEGIDCDASIVLNGREIKRTSNMLIEHRIPVDKSLAAGHENTILVALTPVMRDVRSAGHAYPPGLTAEGSGIEGLYVRKAPHMFGWDIMPRALSAGLWRSVSLRYLPRERLDWAWLDTQRLASDHSEAQLDLHFRAETLGDQGGNYEIRIEGQCGASRFSKRAPLLFDSGSLRLTVESPRLWWPRGRGAPDLYEVSVQLVKNGKLIDRLIMTHGIRTVELERSSVTTVDGDGAFCFVVNGERIFVLGTNWAPVDAYHSRDITRIEAIVKLVVDIGCNMIRCWGGSVYEHDRFYDLCDRNGVLVWQDFAMACAIYPQDESFQEQLRTEVAQVVRRLRRHACVAIWVGDNECDQKYLSGGRRRDPNKNVLTRQVIPAVLRDEDPSRPYLPSSPYVDDIAFVVGERYLPEDHLWGPRDYYKSSFYTTALCHFASEIGYAGCPEPASLQRFLSPDKIWPYQDNVEWRLHSTSPIPGVDIHDYRVELVASQLQALFGTIPDTLEEFAFASQSTQAEALKFFIEMFRSAKWRRTGIIWWNIADGWPQVSDAVVDYYLVKKASYEIVKRAQQLVSVVIREPVGGVHDVVACNDTRDELDLSFVIRDIDAPDPAADLARGRAVAAADAVTYLCRFPADMDVQRYLTIEWSTRSSSGQSHYLAGNPPFLLDRYRDWMERSRVWMRSSRRENSSGGLRPTDERSLPRSR